MDIEKSLVSFNTINSTQKLSTTPENSLSEPHNNSLHQKFNSVANRTSPSYTQLLDSVNHTRPISDTNTHSLKFK